MVETATFRMFDRARPQPRTPPPDPQTLPEARPDDVTQDIRARRRALRESLRHPQAAGPVPASFSSERLSLEYHLLGLANPPIYTAIGMAAGATALPLAAGPAGLVQPVAQRTTPWSGLAYDVAPDGRSGIAPGARVLTARGLVAVEALVPGDAVLGLRGPALLPVLWIGRSIASAPPVRIAAGAFGPGRPSVALDLGADHAVFVDTLPIAARDLGSAGTPQPAGEGSAELFHIDLGSAEVLLVEGIPVASGER